MPEDRNLLYSWNGVRSVANPLSHRHHNTNGHQKLPTSRPASATDMALTLSEAQTQFLDGLAKDNWLPHELEAAALTFGYTQEQVMRYQGLEDEGKVDHFEAYFRNVLWANINEAMTRAKATVSEIAILQWPEDRLGELEEHYLETARNVFAEMYEVENAVTSGCVRDSARWRDLYAGKNGFQRQCELLWMVQARLGRYAVAAD